jgi:hypothetical protein
MEETETLKSDTTALKSVDIISEEDKEKFFKSVLTDQPFQETVSLFDGKLNIVLKTMTVAENNDVVQQINNDKEKGLAENNDAYFITISAYRLALCLVSVDEKEFSKISKSDYKENEEGVTYVRARSLVIRDWPTFKLSAFLEAFNSFESKVLKLTKETQTQNFWKASA